MCDLCGKHSSIAIKQTNAFLDCVAAAVAAVAAAVVAFGCAVCQLFIRAIWLTQHLINIVHVQ